MCSISPSLILGSLLFTGAGRILWLCPTGERWMALSRTTLLAGGDGRGAYHVSPLRLPIRQTRGIQLLQEHRASPDGRADATDPGRRPRPSAIGARSEGREDHGLLVLPLRRVGLPRGGPLKR